MNKNTYLKLGITLIYLISAASFATADEICGDVNCDGTVNMSDAYILADYVSYPYGGYEICSQWAADVTGNGQINIVDAMLISNHVSFPDHDPPYVLRCTEDVSVPEFTTSAVAVIIMLISPIFAYLIVKNRY
jgi:hypothetical protein